MSLLKMYMCDTCEARTEMVLRPPAGWVREVWVPGMVSNTQPRPDRHYCSWACADVAKKKRASELEDE